jgi:hypothetical protein
MTGIQRIFTVDGKPFFPLGGQVHNSSAYAPEELDIAWQALQAINANTVEAPLYWEQVEPLEGQFDWTMLDALLDAARRHKLRLILLWFGTWKNGTMKFTPEWVKSNPKRFWRVISSDGQPLSVLSSHCETTFAADRRAFAAMIEHLKERDSSERTVIAIQVENEPGIIGSDRDYGPEAEQAFQNAVPPPLVQALVEAPDNPATRTWRHHGARTKGTWPELFGHEAGEFFTAWRTARYVDGIAQAGKALYDIPMYTNVWLRENGWRVAGLSYPSGGPTTNTLDIWKWATPHLDLIAPDIYISNPSLYNTICSSYARDDNPLFIPEASFNEAAAINMFAAIAQYNAIGYAPFAIESYLDPETGTPRASVQAVVDSLRCVAAALPLILRYQGTGKLHAVIQEEFLSEQHIDLGDHVALAMFANSEHEEPWSDYRHYKRDKPTRGRGLVVQAGERQFFAVGAGFRLVIKKKGAPETMLSATQAVDFLATRLSNYVRVEEGHFDDEGAWVADRRRSGDESDFGIWVHPDVGVVRAVLAD